MPFVKKLHGHVVLFTWMSSAEHAVSLLLCPCYWRHRPEHTHPDLAASSWLSLWTDATQAFFSMEAPTHSKYDAWRSVVDSALSVNGLPQKDPAAALMRAIHGFVHIGTEGADLTHGRAHSYFRATHEQPL